MRETVGVPYSEWLEYVKAVRRTGLQGEAFEKLQRCYPVRAGSSHEEMVHNELAGLETVLLKKAFLRFEASVNQSIQDADLEIAEKAMREFKKNIRACFFFLTVSGYPSWVRKELSLKVEGNLSLFVDSCTRYVKRLAEEDSSCFTQEFEYLFRKGNLRKFIQEYNVNG